MPISFKEFLTESPMDYKKLIVEADNADKIVKNVGVHPLIAKYAVEVDPANAMWIADRVKNELLPVYLGAGDNALRPVGPAGGAGGKLDKNNPLVKAVKDIANADPNSEGLVYKFVSNYLVNDEIKGEFAGIRDWVQGMNGAVRLKTNPNAPAERAFKGYTFEEAKQATEDWHNSFDSSGTFIEDDPSLEVVMKFPDGFYWVDLKGNSAQSSPACKKESEAMGHCGTEATADTILSLRKKGEPFVTMAVAEGRNSEYSIYIQCKGKARQVGGHKETNPKPLPKYWKYIVDFFIKYQVEGYKSTHKPEADFHPSDLDRNEFQRLVKGDPSIMSFPDVPMLAYTNGLISLEEATKALHIKDFAIDESGVTIIVPKNQMASLGSLCPFPEFNTAGAGDIKEGINPFYHLTLASKENAKMKTMIDNIFKWYLNRNGYEITATQKKTEKGDTETVFSTKGKKVSLIDEMNKLFESGDKFATGLYSGIAKVIRQHNDMMIFPRPAVTNAEGEVVETGYENKVPLNLNERMSVGPKGVEFKFTINEFMDLVESGGGNYKIDSGPQYFTQYASRVKSDPAIKAHLNQQISVIMDVIADFLRKYLEGFVGGNESPDQEGFGFADDFTPDYTSKVDSILAGEEDVQ